MHLHLFLEFHFRQFNQPILYVLLKCFKCLEVRFESCREREQDAEEGMILK